MVIIIKYYLVIIVILVNLVKIIIMNIYNQLHQEHKDFYNLLPETFTQRQAKNLSLQIGKYENYFLVCLRNKKFKQLFNRLSHGLYTKKGA